MTDHLFFNIVATVQTAAASPGVVGFADRLKGMLWTAYGPLIKALGVVVLIVVLVLPTIAFVRKLLR